MARILIIADTYPPNRGGSEASLEIMAEGLARYGHDVRVFTPAVKAINVYAIAPGVQVRRSSVWLKLQELGGHKNALINRTSRLLILPFLTIRLIWLKCDIFIAGHIIPAGAVGITLMRFKRCRAMLVTTYGEEITMYRRGPRMLKLMRKILASAQVITATTENSRAELEDVWPGAAAKAEIIPPAVKRDQSGSTNASDIKLSGSPILFTLSRLVGRKGMDTTIQAVGLLKDELPDLRYYIAGSGPYQERLIELVQSHGLQNRVVFLGAVAAPDQLLAQCDIFCMPNRQLADGEREGFGMVFLEAGLHGKPSIAGRSGGTGDAVLHEKTGLVVTPDDPAATAHAIRTLALNPDYRNQLGRAAKVHAENFTPQRMVDAYEAILQRLLTATP